MARVAGREVAGAPARDAARPRRHHRLERPRPGARVRQGARASPASCSPSSTAPPRAAWRSRSFASWACPSATSGVGETVEDLLPFDAGGLRRGRSSAHEPPGDSRTTRAGWRRALDLAARGSARPTRTRWSGCVIVKGGRVVGEGWHAPRGRPARRGHGPGPARRRARGATLYVTPRALRASRPHAAVRARSCATPACGAWWRRCAIPTRA